MPRFQATLASFFVKFRRWGRTRNKLRRRFHSDPEFLLAFKTTLAVFNVLKNKSVSPMILFPERFGYPTWESWGQVLGHTTFRKPLKAPLGRSGVDHSISWMFVGWIMQTSKGTRFFFEELLRGKALPNERWKYFDWERWNKRIVKVYDDEHFWMITP